MFEKDRLCVINNRRLKVAKEYNFSDYINLKELNTTHKLLIVIDILAIIGVILNPNGFNNPFAKGIIKILYINVQNRFCFIILTVFLLILNKETILDKSSCINITSAESPAISVPLFTETPIVELASDGASTPES